MKVILGDLNQSPPILKFLLRSVHILDYDYKWMLKGWNKIYIYIKMLVYVNILCVLLQDDQSTPWSSVNAKWRMGNHTYPLNTKQHFEKKTHYVKRMTQTNTLGTITIPKHEHWMNTREKDNQYELNQTELYQNEWNRTVSNQQHKYG